MIFSAVCIEECGDERGRQYVDFPTMEGVSEAVTMLVGRVEGGA